MVCFELIWLLPATVPMATNCYYLEVLVVRGTYRLRVLATQARAVELTSWARRRQQRPRHPSVPSASAVWKFDMLVVNHVL